MLNIYSNILRNHHFYQIDNSYSFMSRCINTKMTGGLSRGYSHSICFQEYKYKKQKKDINNAVIL